MPSSFVTWPFWLSARSCGCFWSSSVVTGGHGGRHVVVTWHRRRLPCSPLCSHRCLLCLLCPCTSRFHPGTVVAWQSWGLLRACQCLVCIPHPSCSLPMPLVPLLCLLSSCGVQRHGVGGGTWSEQGCGDGGWWGLEGKNDVTWHRCDTSSRGSGIADTCIRYQMWQLL